MDPKMQDAAEAAAAAAADITAYLKQWNSPKLDSVIYHVRSELGRMEEEEYHYFDRDPELWLPRDEDDDDVDMMEDEDTELHMVTTNGITSCCDRTIYP
jgi:hypothetical protein